MTTAQFERQINYCAAMVIVKRLLDMGAITKDDYLRIHKKFVKKHRPVITLF